MSPFKAKCSIAQASSLICLIAICGCERDQIAIPRTSSISEIGDGLVIITRWNDGPTIMICTDIRGGIGSSGAKTSNPPRLAKEYGSQETSDGRRLNWEMETTDGKTIKLTLNGKDYDLAKGTFFLVKTMGGKTEVTQLMKDLKNVETNAPSVAEFARKDEDASKFLGIKKE